MKKDNADAIRSTYVADLLAYFTDKGEDTAMITSGSINFPVVSNDEEGWLEIVVKVVKDDEGYEKRAEYIAKCKERAEKAEKAKADKERKIAAKESKG